MNKTAVLPVGVRSTEDPFIFLVPYEAIELMDFPEEISGKQVSVVNARHLGAKANRPMSAKGMSLEEMSTLRKSVKEEGWFGSYLARWVKKSDGSRGIQLVAGERRYKSVGKLRESNELCRDRRKDVRDDKGNIISEGQTPAQELYSMIRCEIMEMTDEEAIALNWLENDQHAPIGDRAAIALVKRMRGWDWTDAKITDHVKRGEQWLRETDKLCELDEECFEAVCSGLVNRNGGMLLTKIEDVDERIAVMRRATAEKFDRVQPIIEKKQKEINRAESKEDLARCRKVDAELSGNSEATIKADEAIQKASAEVKKKAEELQKVEKTSTAKQTEIRRSIAAIKPQSMGGNSGLMALRPIKIQKKVVDVIEKWIDNNARDEDGTEFNIEHLEIIRDVLTEVVLNSKIDRLKTILAEYGKSEKAA